MKSISQQIVELLGPPHRWHEPFPHCIVGQGYARYECRCGFETHYALDAINHQSDNNPNYEDDAGAVALLRMMEGREDWPELFMHLLGDGIRGETPPICVLYFNSFLVKYLTTPRLLAKVVLEWLRREG